MSQDRHSNGGEFNNKDWDISSNDHATSSAWDRSIIWVMGGYYGCAVSPDGGGCAGRLVDHGNTNPQLKVVAV